MLIGGRENADLQGFDEQGQPIPYRLLGEHSEPHEIAATLGGREEYWEPVSASGKIFADVPGPVGESATEAYRCYSIGAYRGAIILARAVIEAAAKSKGISGRNLEVKIDALAAQGHVRAEIAASAHEVRFIGNDMAHGDFATTVVSGGDALDILDIMDDVLDQVYGVPTRLERRRARRAEGRE
ncbi:hypothetical protein SRABI121_02630 [Microbacterium sp. Bi121]|nr:hypothetical protein SRABI121_02630 [Microbacterium sp. Bi121]